MWKNQALAIISSAWKEWMLFDYKINPQINSIFKSIQLVFIGHILWDRYTLSNKRNYRAISVSTFQGWWSGGWRLSWSKRMSISGPHWRMNTKEKMCQTYTALYRLSPLLSLHSNLLWEGLYVSRVPQGDSLHLTSWKPVQYIVSWTRSLFSLSPPFFPYHSSSVTEFPFQV
jgi:hypothetical protein